MITPTYAALILALSFFMLYAFNVFKDSEDHFFLAFLFLGLHFLLVTLAGFSLMQTSYCTAEVLNETVTGNTTTYEYGEVCTEKTPAANAQFWITTFYGVGGLIYLIVYTGWRVIGSFGNLPNNAQRKYNDKFR